MLPSNASQPAELRDLILSAGSPADDQNIIQRALQAVRSHLGLQVAYVSEIIGNESVFRVVDAPGLEHLVAPGDRRSLDDVYCRHILEGRLPELIPDTSAIPLAASMPITSMVPIGAHVSVPLRLANGDVYGMFCCLGPAADTSLNARDLGMMRAFAEIAAFEIDRDREATRNAREMSGRVREILDAEDVDMVFQPICSMTDGQPIGVECLSRFAATPVRSPDIWFDEAAAVGLGTDLELLAIRRGLDLLLRLPAPLYMAVNASPKTILDPRLEELLTAHPLDRIVLEITEHGRVDDIDALLAAIAPLRARGLRVAVDDAGSGYSGLQQILQLKPDFIKLDRFLIQGIGTDSSRRALAAALTLFARETGSKIVAEGVETEAELARLQELGIGSVQGYLLGRPEPMRALVDRMQYSLRAA